MQDLISRIAQAVGIDEALANKALGIILNFLNAAGPQEKVQALMAALPGAQDLLSSSGASTGGGGLMGALGGLMGGGMGGAMQALSQLQGAGLGMDQIKGVTQEVVGYAREKADPQLVNDIISEIPGLNQIV